MENREYFPTIGLEIHAELNTNTKMFCACLNNPDEKEPNINICPICMGHPGTLPVPNKEAIKNVLKVGIALDGELADFTEFDRKNYFYPDIPKGYQISQYKYPLVKGGILNGVKITRVHLEEDTASSGHDSGDYSLVDFNRAGVPLMELVTEPVIHSAKEAGDFARELQLTLRYLGVALANMEKGEMRVEANISVSPDKDKFGTKVEVKNLNSFRAVEKAIEYEIERHISLIKKGESVKQETRGFNESNGTTFSQRSKEDSHDYRYFPDPDIPKIYLSELKEFSKAELLKEIPELPWQKRNRYKREFGIKDGDIDLFVREKKLAELFESAMKNLKDDKNLAQVCANYITSDLVGLFKGKDGDGNLDSLKIFPEDFADLVKMIGSREVSSRGAKDILKIMVEEGGHPKKIAEEKNLIQKNDLGALKEVANKIINENPTVVSEYKSGKISVFQFFIGQGMKETKGSANPELLKSIFKEILG